MPNGRISREILRRDQLTARSSINYGNLKERFSPFQSMMFGRDWRLMPIFNRQSGPEKDFLAIVQKVSRSKPEASNPLKSQKS